MSDNASGQNAEHWKQKYYDQLDQLDKKEKEWADLESLLRRTIGRLSLAAEGHHKTLDRHIQDIRMAVKESINPLRLESALDELSSLLTKIEATASTSDHPSLTVLQSLLTQISLPEHLEKFRKKILKELTKSTDDDSPALITEIASLLQKAMQHASDAEPDDRKAGLLGRLLGTQDDRHEQSASLSAASDAGNQPQPQAAEDDVYLAAYKNCVLSILDKMDNSATPDGRIAALRLSASSADEKNQLDKLAADLAAMLVKTVPSITGSEPGEHDKEQPRIQELLIRLLEQLVVPVDLHEDVEAMKMRLEAEKEPADWKQLLKDVAYLINSIRSRMQQEKNEFEDFLQQMTTRLRELDHFLQTESETWKQAEQDGRNFDDRVNTQVQDIRDDVIQASELKQLKQRVENRLDIISQHILQYRHAESQRYADTQKNVEAMQTRMQSLEQETEKLKIVINEKNKQAVSDTLTGIPNRLAFDQRIEVEIARWKRFGHPLSLAVWDVDYFKHVNDTYGHKAGDKVLKTIAQLLNKRIRQTDFIARYGGEEFVMLLPGTKEEETLRLVNELRRQVEECGFHYHGKAVTITVSCGVSSFREHDSLEQVFERADKALYKAKKNGRNQCVIASVRSD